MSKTCYDPKIDDEILKIIDRDKETRFNMLVVEIGDLLTIHLKQKKKKLKRKGSMGIRRTIRRHLTFLSEDNNKILLWTRPTTPGKAGSIKYTPQAEIKRKYGFLAIDYSGKRGICKEWKKENIKDKEMNIRKKKTILFLLLTAAYGYTGYKHISQPRPGDIAIKEDNGKPIDVSPYFERGFSIKDLDKQDFQLSAIHSILWLNKFTKPEIEEMLEELKKGKDVILRPTIGSDGKEERYDIEDDVLKELLIWCCNILRYFVSMMKQYWFILGKKPKSDEAQWFSLVVGEKTTMNLFQKINKNRVEKKKTIRELYIEYHFNDADLDKEIIDRDLKGKEAYYRDTYNLDIFTKKGMEEYIFTHSKESFFLRLHCDLIASDKEKYQELVKEEKYQWIFEELVDLVNPPFSKSKYKVKLT